MPKLTLTNAGPSNAGIAADSTRTYLEFSTSAATRFSIGGTYVEDDSQPLLIGDQRIFTDANAKLAFSFPASLATIVSWNKV